MRLDLCVATMSPTLPDLVRTFTRDSVRGLTPEHVKMVYNTAENNLGVIGSYQALYKSTEADVLAYIHDDVICREVGWDERVMKEFEDPTVGVVGFGGGLNHGTDDIYKTPYRLQQLARGLYRSNTDDAEVHGQRFAGTCDVAVVDGFAIVVRRSLLDSIRGWPVERYPPHHNYDYFICCAAHSCGLRVRLVALRCHHLGGRTALSEDYAKWAAQTRWGSDVAMHEAGHRLIYDEFRSVLPWRCSGE